MNLQPNKGILEIFSYGNAEHIAQHFLMPGISCKSGIVEKFHVHKKNMGIRVCIFNASGFSSERLTKMGCIMFFIRLFPFCVLECSGMAYAGG